MNKCPFLILLCEVLFCVVAVNCGGSGQILHGLAILGVVHAVSAQRVGNDTTAVCTLWLAVDGCRIVGIIHLFGGDSVIRA